MKTFQENEREANIQMVYSLTQKINPEELPEDLLREYAQFLVSLKRLILMQRTNFRYAKILNFFFTVSLIFLPKLFYPQCLVPPLAPSCSPPGAIAVVNNDAVAPGQVKTLNTNASFNSLTVSGGTLIVCSSLTLNTISFTSGTLIINPGASVLINSSTAIVFGNNSSIINYGNFKITSSIVTGQNNLFFNASTSSVFTVAFNQFVIQGPNTYIINNGVLNASYIIVQSANSPGPVCSGIGSYMVCNFMINQYPNAFLSPAGPSCINITQSVINSQPMTSTSNVMICYLASNVSISGSANFGSATVNSNCPSCLVALPLKLTNFSSTCYEGRASLNWQSEDEKNVRQYFIEQSLNGSDFFAVGSVLPIQTPGITHYYNYNADLTEKPNENYFRIKEVDKNGEFAYSKIIYTSCLETGETLLYPALTNDYFKVQSPAGIESIKIFDISGRLIKTEWFGNTKLCSVYLNEFAEGSYIILIKTTTGVELARKCVRY